MAGVTACVAAKIRIWKFQDHGGRHTHAWFGQLGLGSVRLAGLGPGLRLHRQVAPMVRPGLELRVRIWSRPAKRTNPDPNSCLFYPNPYN